MDSRQFKNKAAYVTLGVPLKVDAKFWVFGS
jgi:hypothetical protein